MNIILATQYFYPSSSGGTESYVHELALNLIKLGNNVAVITVNQCENYYFENYYVFGLPQGDFTNVGRNENLILEKFESILVNFSAEVFHLNTIHEKMNALFLERARKLGVKCYYTSHLASNTCLRGNLMLFGKRQCDGKVIKSRCLSCALQANQNKLHVFAPIFVALDSIMDISHCISALNNIKYIQTQLNLLKNNIHQIFVQSEWQKKIYELNGFPSDKVTVVRLGLSNIFFEEKNISRQPLSVGFIGRFSPDKGLKVLIKALKLIQKPLKVYICVVINKNQIDEIKDLFKEVNNFHEIIFKFNQSQENIRDLLDKISLLIIPSTTIETGPYVAIEALARKTFVIGSDMGGIAEIIVHGKNGFLFKKEDYISLCNLITKYFEEYNDVEDTPFISNNIYSSLESTKKILNFYITP